MRKTLILMFIIVSILIISGCDKVSDPQYNVDKSACNSCGSCISICPRDAIELGPDGKAIIDQTKCNQCSRCIAVCPKDAIH